MTTILPPGADEYSAPFAGYVSRAPHGEIIASLAAQPAELRTLLSGLDDGAALYRFESDAWSIKEVIGHLSDCERVFAYRALCFARGDAAQLPGFEQDDYVREANYDDRTLDDLLEEFAALRHANVLGFQSLAPEVSERRGNANNASISVRALLYVMDGHVVWHIESLKADYLARMAR